MFLKFQYFGKFSFLDIPAFRSYKGFILDVSKCFHIWAHFPLKKLQKLLKFFCNEIHFQFAK